MALKKDQLSGILPAMVTPTDRNGRINKSTARRLVGHLIHEKVGGLVPLGGTGEYPALSPLDRATMVETVVDEAAGRVPVIAGILSPGFKEAVSSGMDFKKAGADGVMLVTPYYIKPGQEGIREYFAEFISRVKLPVVIYDIPYRTGVYLDPATINKIVDEGGKMVIGMKACNTDLAHFTRLMALVSDKISVLSGEEYLFMSEVILGAKGGILASANAFPRPWVKMFEMISAGDIDGARRIHFGLVPLMDAVFAESNPGPLKEAMPMVGFDVGHPLSPLSIPNKENLIRLKAAVQALLKKSF
jgi:4-hydroxy-tetrahydrodipicolinate synthase